MEVVCVEGELEGRNMVQHTSEVRGRRLCRGQSLMERQGARAGGGTGICKGDPGGPSAKRKATERGVHDSRRPGFGRWLSEVPADIKKPMRRRNEEAHRVPLQGGPLEDRAGSGLSAGGFTVGFMYVSSFEPKKSSG